MPRLEFDPDAALAHLRAADPVLAAVIDQVGPFTLKLKPAKSLFEAMMQSIIYQQLHGKAAASIHARVLTALEGHGGATANALVTISDGELRAAGLSGNKLLAIRDLALKCRENIVPTLREARRLDDAELIARLTEVRGIGTWTVQMLLIFYLGRPDVLPTGDFSVRLAFQRIFRKRKNPAAEVIIRHARKWHPYRSVASWYLWRSLEIG